ncbi:MAG: 3-hydroxyacyl-CoA dehydrogenase/enoyl-CoA hydratase family protein [Deltaproteobacteria bacterium]|nr:3-hydroxyacyl-CoA dehydrogenase/enoyl-CoA hydratase family protein [Deltaproteobacteria bacterium]
MIVGVIGSGSIGPDLAYGFVSALGRTSGSRVYLLDIKKDALDAGVARIKGYVGKALGRGKLSPKAAKAVEDALCPTMELRDLASCDYVLEAATEDLPVKKSILAKLEAVVRPDCLVGFATSGIPRAQIAAQAKHPDRCFVNHPFFPAWRAQPIEVVLSEDKALSARMLETLRLLGKVPIVTADVPCFAADDVFCNYCAEAVRIYEEGVASVAQIDAIVNDAIGGGGPFNVMDLTRGNLLNIHCLDLMKEAPTGSGWFTPPASFAKQANTPWHDRSKSADARYDAALGKQVLDRILAVIVGRSYFVVDEKICDPRELNWMTRTALGFKDGLLDLAEKLGAERVHEICTSYAASHPGFAVPPSIAKRKLARFHRTVAVSVDGEVGVISIQRPEVRNALSDQVMDEIQSALSELAGNAAVRAVVLTSFDGAIAGADIQELAALKTPAEAREKCLRGQAVLDRIAACGKPVVAAVDGPVMGGGCELAMACHARVVGPGLMLGQPEVNLGIIPGYGGTQRLPRLVGVERGLELLRTGRTVGAKEACEWGWATGSPEKDFVRAAKELVRRHLRGETKLAPVSPEPKPVPARLAAVDIGHRSRVIDAVLVEVVREGLSQPLAEGLKIEAQGFERCRATVDMDIGMKNFIQNGPRVPAAFLHE